MSGQHKTEGRDMEPAPTELTPTEIERMKRLQKLFTYSDEEARRVMLAARDIPPYNPFGKDTFEPASGDGKLKR